MNERVYVAAVGITPFGKRLAAGVASLTQPDLLMKGGCKNPAPPRRWPTAHGRRVRGLRRSRRPLPRHPRATWIAVRQVQGRKRTVED